MSFDALTLAGMLLLVLLLVLLLYLCNRTGITCNDRSRHTDADARELARRLRS